MAIGKHTPVRGDAQAVCVPTEAVSHEAEVVVDVILRIPSPPLEAVSVCRGPLVPGGTEMGAFADVLSTNRGVALKIELNAKSRTALA